ncbi:hypothetical protein KR222_004585, partial [Zaprionus bogoriensis]
MDNHVTIHEQMGQPHFPLHKLTKYVSQVNFTEEPEWNQYGMGPVHWLTRSIFDFLYGNGSTVPSGKFHFTRLIAPILMMLLAAGYHSNTTIALGPKVEKNDWACQLSNNKLVFFWVMFLLFLIIIMPFIAVCYCCFCCCRCKPTCPPCNRQKYRGQCICCSILLILLILGLLLGLLTAFLNEKLTKHGFEDNAKTLARGNKDTCAYLKDSCDHVNHIFVNNFEELLTHMTSKLYDANAHIFLDLTVTSGSDALAQLETILTNMPKVLKLMKELHRNHRNLIYLCSFIRDCDMPHFQLPKTEKYIDAIQEIVSKQLISIPKRGIQRLQKVNDLIKHSLEPKIPGVVQSLEKAHLKFIAEAHRVCSIITALITDIQQSTVRSVRNYDDVYDKYEKHRRMVNITVIAVLFVVRPCVTLQMPHGFITTNRSQQMYYFSVIILIFSVFSLIVLVTLFYFMLGLIMYQGACMTASNKEEPSSLHTLDSEPFGNDTQKGITAAIRDCKENKTIFELFKEHSVYNVDYLKDVELVHKVNTDNINFDSDLHNLYVLTRPEYALLREIANGNLSDYLSSLYTNHICETLSPANLDNVVQSLKNLSSHFREMHGTYVFTKIYILSVNLRRISYDLIESMKMHRQTLRHQGKMKVIAKDIESLITLPRMSFGKTIHTLINITENSEEFLKTRGSQFVNVLIKNLSESLESEVNLYKDRVIRIAKEDIGKCGPIAYIHQRNKDRTCRRLVDPINGFWFGLLICALLLLPILCVAHRLICLFIAVGLAFPVAAGVILAKTDTSCPVCTGAPYVP